MVLAMSFRSDGAAMLRYAGKQALVLTAHNVVGEAPEQQAVGSSASIVRCSINGTPTNIGYVSVMP
jgi:hypothetical protein